MFCNVCLGMPFFFLFFILDVVFSLAWSRGWKVERVGDASGAKWCGTDVGKMPAARAGSCSK